MAAIFSLVGPFILPRTVRGDYLFCHGRSGGTDLFCHGRSGGTIYSATDGPGGPIYSATDGPGGPILRGHHPRRERPLSTC